MGDEFNGIIYLNDSGIQYGRQTGSGIDYNVYLYKSSNLLHI